MPAYTSARYAHEGTETTETSIVRVGGATDPAGQIQSRQIVTTPNAHWLKPYKGEPLAVWNPTAGANVTATVYGAAAGLLPLNDEIWAEFEFLGSASSALGTIVTTTKANVLATGAAVSSDSSTWSGGGASPTFNGTITAGVTLSNGDLTATHTDTSSSRGVISATYVSTGKYYFEFKSVTTTGITPDVGIVSNLGGVVTGTEGFKVTLGASASNIVNDLGGTGISLGASTLGTVFSFAIDLTNNLGWICKNGGSWNADPAANPAMGTGGVLIRSTGLAGRSFAPYVHFSTSNGEILAGNFGQSSFAYAPPSGFFNWGIITPFKLTTTLSSPQPGQAGYLHGRVRVGKASAIYFIDPQIELSAAAGGTSNVATAYKSSRYTYEGTETTETSVTRTGGTADPTGQVQSRKIVTTANAQWLNPFKAEPYAVWNATTGSITATVYGNAATLPLTDEIWAEFEFLGSGSSTLGSIVTTTKANVLAAGTSVASDASTWGGGTTPFKLAATFTPGQAGYVHARIRVAKASATYYIDPQVYLS